MESSIVAYRVEITRQGGYIKGRTEQGNFLVGPLGYDLTGAIATVVRGPNATFDSSTNAFACKADNSTSRESFIAKGGDDGPEDKSTIKVSKGDLTTPSDSNALPSSL